LVSLYEKRKVRQQTYAFPFIQPTKIFIVAKIKKVVPVKKNIVSSEGIILLV